MATDSVHGECSLCRSFRPLVKSHLLPAALYRHVRVSDRKNTNPILVTSKIHKSTSAQIQQYLLCEHCEDRFNKRGERWVLHNCFRGAGKFLLHARLASCKPSLTLPDFQVFEAMNVPGIDVAQLAYFGVSVFWRAAVKPWRVNGDTTQISLWSRYEEELRLWLLDLGDFPQDGVLWVSLGVSPNPTPAFCTPYTERRDRYHQHRFVIPGIMFHLFLGKKIDPILRLMCLLRSPGHAITMGEKVDSNPIKLLRDIISRAKVYRSRRALCGDRQLPAKTTHR
jgi:hypothetical protein